MTCHWTRMYIEGKPQAALSKVKTRFFCFMNRLFCLIVLSEAILLVSLFSEFGILVFNLFSVFAWCDLF